MKTQYFISLLLITILFFTCKKEEDNTEKAVPTSVTILSANNQTVQAGTTLSEPISLLVKDQNGNPYAGAIVKYYIDEGSLSKDQTTTNSEGKAETLWTLGNSIGEQIITIAILQKDGETTVAHTPYILTVNTVACMDIDGNVYNVITIGNQTWMAENLKVEHYADGSQIILVNSDYGWMHLLSNNTDAACCIYNHNENNEKDTYGVLYTWAAVMGGNAVSSDSNPSGVRGIAPEGWHIPSLDEYSELINHLGGIDVSGGELKETGTTHWAFPNTGATNSSGFTGLPGGLRDRYADFTQLSYRGVWWCSKEYTNNISYAIAVQSDDKKSTVYALEKAVGVSVRCVKD